jgi:hypothetical protein
MSYAVLADCIRSGQLSARQVADILADEVFREWYLKRFAP